MTSPLQQVADYELPANYEVEQALLSAILADNRLMTEIAGRIEPRHFAEPVHGRIFEACARRIADGRVADHRILARMFDADGALKDVDGGNYLRALSDSAITLHPASIASWAETLRHLWTRRQVIQLAEDLKAGALDRKGDDSPQAVLEQAEAALFDLAGSGGHGGPVRLGDVLKGTLADIERRAQGKSDAVSTGFADLDAATGGLEAPDLVVVGGRPSMGKTTLATNMMVRLARAGRASLLFSLEMGSTAIARRILAEHTDLEFTDLQRGRNYGADTQGKLTRALEALETAPIWLDDRSGLTIHQMHAAAKRLIRQHPLACIVVDHLGYVPPPDPRAGKVDQIGDVMKGAKAMAKALQVPVVMLCQLSRALTQRDDKRPQLPDLRASGNIEEDADAVWFVHREAYYLERAEPEEAHYPDPNDYRIEADKWQARLNTCRNTLDVIIAKQRSGPVKTVHLYFDGRFMRIADLEQREMELA